MGQNGRSREAKLYRAFRQELVRHVGGHPSPAQNALIHRLSWLQVHLALMDERMMLDGVLSDHASRQYLAWGQRHLAHVASLGAAVALAEAGSGLIDPPRGRPAPS